MYFVIRALKYLRRKIGKTVFMGVIFFVIANFVLAGLLIKEASALAEESTRLAIGSDVTYTLNTTTLIEDIEKGVLDRGIMQSFRNNSVLSEEDFTNKGAPTVANIKLVTTSEYVSSYQIESTIDVTNSDYYQVEVEAEGVNNGIFESNKEPLEKIVKHCDNLKHQIEDVIFLSQLETKKQIFDLQPVAIEDIINEILDDFEVIFLKKDIEIYYQPDSKTMVNIDPDKMIRAISNIILNGTKYTKSEFKVEIQVFEEMVKILFSDDGPGFSEEVLEYPFMGYYESKESGNGIGLMIVYKIMEAHQGEVKIYNTSKGAVVEIQFKKTT